MIKTRYIAAAVLLAVGVCGLPSFKVPQVTSSITIEEPSEKMKSAVKAVAKVAARMNSIDRLWFQSIYKNASVVMRADGLCEEPVMTTMSSARAVHVAILEFIWRGLAKNESGKFDGLSEAVEEAFLTVVGTEHRAMTPALRAELSSLYDAIAWAGLGKDE